MKREAKRETDRTRQDKTRQDNYKTITSTRQDKTTQYDNTI